MRKTYISSILLFFCLTSALCVGVPSAWGAEKKAKSEDVTLSIQKYQRFQQQYAARVEKLAAWCDENELTECAETTRNLTRGMSDDDNFYFAILPQTVQTAQPKNSSGDLESEWREKYDDLRSDASDFLLKLAKKTVQAGHASLGFDILMRSLRENPDNEDARKLLGYKQFRGEWVSDFEIAQYKSGKVNHPQFGWIPKTYVSRYERGERFYNGKWISAEQDAVLHADIQNGWIIDTPHYRIVTNHSIAAGVKIGEQVETFYRVWKQLFLRYYMTQPQLEALFEGRPGAAVAQQRHLIYFFRSEQNYRDYLRANNPQIEMSVGLYSSRDRIAYFFAGENFSERTVYHECTHQLFNEIRKTDPEAGNRGNFWVIEGIAAYMESLRTVGEFHVVGGFEDLRLLAARLHYNRSNFYVPTDDLTAMRVAQFQQDPNVAKLYSQSCALVCLLIHYQGGKYRDGLSQSLIDIYTGKDNLKTLPRYLGIPFSELDSEYDTFITRNKEDLDNWQFQ